MLKKIVNSLWCVPNVYRAFPASLPGDSQAIILKGASGYQVASPASFFSVLTGVAKN